MKMKKWIDLSIGIDEDFLVYPGDPKIEIEDYKTIETDGFNIKTVKTAMHVGTHLDYKSHMLKTEEKSEDFDINKLIGRANVVRPKVVDNIVSTNDIIKAYEDAEEKTSILLVDCSHADKVNTPKYYDQPKFESSLFAFLKEHHIKVFGVDLPTVVYHDSQLFLQMHYDLLDNGMTIIENLTNMQELGDVVDFIALPIKIKDIDGALVRAVAKNIDNV